MLAQARRANGHGMREGRVDLRRGEAQRLPFDGAAFDRVVAVNNCQAWRDPAAGLREARRVLRPGGTVTVALHSATAPGRFKRRLGLPEERLEDVRRLAAEVFADVRRHDLVYSVAFTANRDDDGEQRR